MPQTQSLDKLIKLIEQSIGGARHGEAQQLLNKLFEVNPTHPRGNELLAYLLIAKGDYQKGYEQLKVASELDGALPSAFYALGRYYFENQNITAAIKNFENALIKNFHCLELLHDLGIAYALIGRLKESEQILKRALALDSASPEVNYNLGRVHDDMKNFDDAVKYYSNAIRYNPNFAEAYINLGDVNMEIGNFENAIKNYNYALEINQNLIDAYINRGVVLHTVRRFDQAISSFDQALAIDNKSAGAHFNKALTLIALGKNDLGWEEYEWRWRYEKFTSPIREFPKPLWSGEESLCEKTILVHSEQGLGDTIQFCRYLRILSERKCYIYVEVEESLVRLIQGMNTGISVIVKGAPLPTFDYHCPMMSLPLALKVHAQSPPFINKYLSIGENKVNKWANLFKGLGAPRIGIVWRGSSSHKNDLNRSIPLIDLINYLPKGPQYISLQKDLLDSEIPLLKKNFILSNCFDGVFDFQDTAGMLSQLDLIIGVDTSTIHLSGALGKKTWLLLSYIQDWRWPHDGGHSLWYESVKILRQAENRKWKSLLEKLTNDIQNFTYEYVNKSLQNK